MVADLDLEAAAIGGGSAWRAIPGAARPYRVLEFPEVMTWVVRDSPPASDG